MGSDTNHHHSLTLELGFNSSSSPNTNTNTKTLAKPPSLTDSDREPTLTLGLSTTVDKKVAVVEDRAVSATSSLLNISVKRERESASSEDMVSERGCISRASDEDEEGTGPTTTTTTTTRKKLRLTKDQSAFLEESFKLHSSLNPKQKQALADRLNLRPRQVEVWFQNRRARTKLKQTEVDCEYLKKCFETLTDENRRLQKELEELKSMKVSAHPLYMQLPAATLTMCPSCERIAAGNPPVPSKTTFAKTHFFPSFPKPSAAC